MQSNLSYNLPSNYLNIRNQLDFEFSKSSNDLDLKELLTVIKKFDLLKNISLNDNYDPDDLLYSLLCIGYACNDQGLLLSLGAHFFAAINAIKSYGNSKHYKILHNLEEGRKIAAFAATEADSGSDIMSMQCKFEKTDNHYILNGDKCYITNATTADYFLIFATKNHKLYDRGISLFLVPKETLGLTIESNIKSETLINSGVGKIKLDNVSIPHEYLIGKENQGAKIFHHCIKLERAFILIPHVGMMMKWFDICLDHTNNRKQFNTAITNFQMIEDKIIDIYRHLTTSKLLAKEITRNALSISDIDASMVKLTISEALLSTHQKSLEILGAIGILGHSDISSKLIDSFASTIYSGTSNIQKIIISTGLKDN
ncbi:MAG: acyl-CoA dehydrogenase family protein [Gammaproteobacteria bacterium]